MELGFIGLGRMGMNMVKRISKKHKVYVFNRTEEKMKETAKFGAKPTKSVAEMVKSLKSPRIIWSMLPSGQVTEEHLSELLTLMGKGDILIEGGNANFKDTVRRAEMFKSKGIYYLDVGTSGGVVAAKTGYCLMIGGDRVAYEKCEPILKVLAIEEGYGHMGPSGSGHYVKMVHNAIEYGMMQAMGEGFELLTKSPYAKDLDLKKVSHVWNHGSIVSGFLMQMAENAFTKDSALKSTVGYVEDTGEGRWAVQEAIDRNVAFSVITESLFARFNSREKDAFYAKVLQALRYEFGGHQTNKK